MNWIMGKLAGLAGKSLFKYIASGLATAVVVVYGMHLINHYRGLVTTKAKYEAAVITIEELQNAKQDLVDQLGEQEKRHNEEVARLNEDREALDAERFAIQKRAFAEAGRLKEKLRLNEDAKNWHDTAIPDSIKQLRE